MIPLDTKLTDSLNRLHMLRHSLHSGSMADLDLMIAIAEQALSRPSVLAKARVSAVLDMILSVDPRFVAAMLSAAAKAAELALAEVMRE